MKRRTMLAATTGLAMSSGLGLGIPLARAMAALKVGFVYVTPIGDAGWTHQHELGRLALEREFGSKVKTKYVDSVGEGAEAERVIRQFAADGYDLVFTTSFGYMNPTIKVAKRFPNVAFAHCSGYKRAKNVSTYLARFYEGRYLTGMVAGAMTKTNIGGHVAAFPIPEVVRGINAFVLGMRVINPKATLKVVWVNSWFDPGREREATEALIVQGVDVVTQHTDSTAVVQAAQEKGIWSIGYHSDMSKYGPDTHLTASTQSWDNYYIETVRQVMDGSWVSNDVWGGINAGMIQLAPINGAVPMAMRRQVRQMSIAIRDGHKHPFDGPLFDQSGNQVVAAGAHLSDDDLLRMGYYVQGVQGRLPG